MNNSGKNTVAIFLAAVFVTGIFAVLSPSIIDTEASGDNKNKDRHGDKSKSSSVKYINCKNINLNINDLPGNANSDIASTLEAAQTQEKEGSNVDGLSADSILNGETNHQDRNQGFQKFTDKDVVVICVFNNNGNENGNGPPNGVGDCDRCFLPINVEGGIIPPGELTKLNTYLAENPPDSIDNVRELCEFIERVAGTSNEVTEREIRALLGAALPGESNKPVIDNIIECLLEENLITPSSPQ